MNHENLTRLIARRKFQDFLFNILGVVCTLVGVVTLAALLLDLVIDSFGLLRHYHKDITDVPANAYRVEPVTKKGRLAGGKLTLSLDGRELAADVSARQYNLLLKEKTHKIELRGSELNIPLPGKEDVTIELTEDERKHLTRDVGALAKSWQVTGTFMTSFPSRHAAEAGILSAWVGTLLITLVTAALAVPLGVAAGVYLEEYARRNWLTTLIEINISNLAGVPSILYGLLALGLLLYQLNLDRLRLGGDDTDGWPLGPKGSVAAAGVTLALLILPIVIVATRESLRAIP